MSYDKSKQGEADRSRVSGSEDYEVTSFARKHDSTIEQARELIDKHGNDRSTLDAAAGKLQA